MHPMCQPRSHPSQRTSSCSRPPSAHTSHLSSLSAAVKKRPSSPSSPSFGSFNGGRGKSLLRLFTSARHTGQLRRLLSQRRTQLVWYVCPHGTRETVCGLLVLWLFCVFDITCRHTAHVAFDVDGLPCSLTAAAPSSARQLSSSPPPPPPRARFNFGVVGVNTPSRSSIFRCFFSSCSCLFATVASLAVATLSSQPLMYRSSPAFASSSSPTVASLTASPPPATAAPTLFAPPIPSCSLTSLRCRSKRLE
mmetsp:Transcript_14090/g.35319  ORF Transcript_14090/g.35319 Transcript_14090/m.35319 type:complete len:250 (-) Transcript_14090:94-843(-)